MPFQDGVYYPLSGGTHSSAGIASLLSSPCSVMTPSTGNSSAAVPAAAIPFKFRPRRESVDWRRINAVDVDLVVSQLDVDALQEHLGAVTFCSLEGERCPRCQSPVDPALVKVLRLAQLTVEWLLHCQDFLALNLRAAEEKLAAAGRERDELLEQQRRREEKEKALVAELKQRKKVIRTQQSLLAPRIVNHKCQHCDKTFMNASFLEGHMQRRHPDEFDIQMRSDSEKSSQINGLKSEISSLKEQIVQQQQALQAKIAQEKEQQSLQKDLLRELDRFKAEEMARMDRKIEDSRDGMRREMEFLYNRNIQALNEANQSARQEKTLSPAHSQPERDVDGVRDEQLHKLQHHIQKQDKIWESRLQEMRSQHESEKNQLRSELSRMRSSVSEQLEHSQRLQQEMSRKLQEKEHTIRAQREKINSKVEVPVVVSAPPPEPKPKRVVVLEEPVPALKLDPIQELSEEDRDSSSVSERRPAERKPEAPAEKKARPSGSRSVLRKNPDIKEAIRPELQQALSRKLEVLGVRPDQTSLKSKDLSSVLARVKSKWDSVAKANPEYRRQRREICRAVEKKLSARRSDSEPALHTQARTRQQVQVLQIRPRSSSLPSRASQPASTPAAKQPKTPQPAPRTRTIKTSTPTSRTALRTPASKTPPFSSEEKSEDDSDSEKPAPKPHRAKPGTPLQTRGGRAVAGRKPSDDDDWSEVSELQEIDPKQLGGFRDQNGNVPRRNPGKENRIGGLVRKMETQLAERVLKKPAGGVSVLPEKTDEVQELTYTDLEESDWAVSSLEDRTSSLRKSLDSPSTSVWGTSTGKAPRSGPVEAGTGSTLKSSLCSLSDISDSDDASVKPGRF